MLFQANHLTRVKPELNEIKLQRKLLQHSLV